MESRVVRKEMTMMKLLVYTYHEASRNKKG